MLIELVRYKSKLPFDYYKEIILNYRKLLPRLDIQKIQDYALMAPKSNKVLEIFTDGGILKMNLEKMAEKI